MITQLKNPLIPSPHYQEFKEYVLDVEFPWYKNPSNSGNPGFFGHVFIRRPEESWGRFPQDVSTYTRKVADLFQTIMDHNNIEIKSILRLNLNLVYPVPFGKQTTPPHIDHEFPHYNFLLYLTNAGGKLVVGKESFDPREDDVVIFEGETHYIHLPKKDLRVALVATYI